jgi:hypothetical protein
MFMTPNRFCAVAAALLATVGLPGCFLFGESDTTLIGRFAVEARLVADSCGPGTVDADPLLQYNVELRQGGSVVTWDGPGLTLQGPLGADDQFCIDDSSTWKVREADLWLEDPGCSMTRIERLCALLEDLKEVDTVEEGEPLASSFTGRHELFISHEGGSDCTDQLGLADGQYLTLPCQVTYDIVGQLVE